jgi:predicted peptidase
MVLFFLLSGCSPAEENLELRSGTANRLPPTEAASPTKSQPALIETAIPLSPTEVSFPTESQPALIETATQNESTPVSVSPFLEGSIGPGEHKAYSFQSSSGEEIIFWLYLPEEYDDSQTWPLILSIHGFLGFEPSLERVFEQSPPNYVDPDVEFPFIVIAPQAPNGSWAQYHEPMDELIEFLSESISIDPDTQFLTGLSAGAIPAWHWALAFPGRFTGMASIAGSPSLDSSIPENICSLKDLPIWVAHSEADQNVPMERARAVVMAMEECGSTVTHFTTYADLSHLDSTRMAFGGPELYDWMLALMEPTLN